MGRWLFRLLLTEHYGTRGSGLRTAVPGMDRPYCLCPPPLRDPARLLRQRQDTAPKYGHPDQQFLPARPPLSGLPWPPCPQGCLLASSGRKAGTPWRGQARCVQVRAATFLVISPTGRRGRRVPPGFPTPLFLRLTQKRPFFVPGVYLRGLAPEAPVASAGAWRCLGGADGATPGRAAATFSGSRALWGACACGISEGPNRTR